MLAAGTMPLTAAQLVGRADEVRSLDHLLTELSRGAAGALAIVGEPGIGKTRLLAELGARADERRFLVLTGSAAELENDLPFWVFVDALDDYVHGLEPQRLDALDADARAQLGHVLPALAPHTDGAPAERFRMHRAVRDLLETLGHGKPLVLVLDDLHWADSGSIDLLGSLLRRPPPPRLRAAGGRRSAGARARRRARRQRRGRGSARAAAGRTGCRRWPRRRRRRSRRRAARAPRRRSAGRPRAA